MFRRLEQTCKGQSTIWTLELLLQSEVDMSAEVSRKQAGATRSLVLLPLHVNQPDHFTVGTRCPGHSQERCLE